MSALIVGNECPWVFELPKGWEIVQRWGDGYAVACGGLRALIDCSLKADGNWWLHLSVSRKSWCPTHDDMTKAKAAFLGNRYAYSVWVPAERHVNIHPFCLHLWARFDGLPLLPDFDEVLPGIGRSV